MEEIKIINYGIIEKNRKSIIKDEEFNIFGYIINFKNKKSILTIYKIAISYFLKFICIYLSFLFLFLFKEYAQIINHKYQKQNYYQQNKAQQNNLQKHQINNSHYHHNKKKKKNLNFQYFSCFVGLGREENKYIREFIEYYLKLGVGKFILGDNNLPNQEKFSDVLQDYIKNGTVDIIELFGSTLGQSELYQMAYDKYKTKCNWFLLFDFDEYLEIFFEKGKNLKLKEFLTNNTYEKCEAILFNLVIYTDNDLLYYDNRTLIERFTEPNFFDKDNIYVKSIVRGGLNKTIFFPNRSNHVPDRRIFTCNSKGDRVNTNPYSLNPPVYDYGYLKHYTTKTAEEFCEKIIKGPPRNVSFKSPERVKLFFTHNKFSFEKLEIFERKFNRSYNLNYIVTNYRQYNMKLRFYQYFNILFFIYLISFILNNLLFL